MSERKKLTRQEIGRLGGLTAADRMTPEQRRERATKGGNGLLNAKGRAYFTRMAYRRQGRDVQLT